MKCEWEEWGLFFVYDNLCEFEEYEVIDWLLWDEFGVVVIFYDVCKIVELELVLKLGLGGGWYYEGDVYLCLDMLMKELRWVL